MEVFAYSVAIDFQNYATPKARTDVARRNNWGVAIVRIANKQHGLSWSDLEVSLVALLGINLPLGADHGDGCLSRTHEAADVAEALLNGHVLLQRREAVHAVGAVDAGERLDDPLSCAGRRIVGDLKLGRPIGQELHVVVLLRAHEHVDASGEVGPRVRTIQSITGDLIESVVIQNGGASRKRVVAKALVERPVRFLELGGRIAAPRQGALVGILGAVLKDGGEDLVRLGPFLKIARLNVSRYGFFKDHFQECIAVLLTHQRGSTRGDSEHRLE